ncbi:MAG: hypothetical protein J5659_01635 [Clostridia bacterium]|nr:hypothetical protein [Clostridia bacterium]
MKASEIKEIASLLNIGIPVVATIVVFIACACNIDKLLLFISFLQKVFSFCSSRARKGSISNSIRGKILRSSKDFRSISNSLISPDLKIEWVKEESAETFIKNNQVIIRMSQNSNPHKNFVTAVNAYIGSGLLPKAQRYIDPSILSVSRVAVCRKLIINGDPDAIDYFDDNILSPLTNSSEECAEIYDELKTIDRNGMFVNILLNEYAKASQKVFPDDPDPLLLAESKELLTYLHRIAKTGIDDVSELQFNREYFKVHIFLTAKTSTYLRSGIKPYLRHIANAIGEGINTVYIFGLGKKIAIANEITSEIKKTDFRVDSVIPHHYRHKSIDGRTVHGVCFEVNVYDESNE